MQHLRALPDAARQEDASCTSWKAKTDALLSDWQAHSTAGVQEAAMHADAALQTAGSALASLHSQVLLPPEILPMNELESRC